MVNTKKADTTPTHRAVLETGESVDYRGAHPTHWTFGGADADGKRDGSPVRIARVTSVYPLSASAEDDENYDE